MTKSRKMNEAKNILIGGQALKELGNDRHTDDVDYLIFDESNSDLFITGEGVDYINAAKNEFYKEVYNAFMNEEISYKQLLAETKAFAFVQHCKNFNFQKADASEYDLKFLHRTFSIIPAVVKKHVDSGAWSEIKNIY